MSTIVGPNFPFVTRGQPVVLDMFIDSSGQYFVEIETVRNEFVSHVHYFDLDEVAQQMERGLRAWLSLTAPSNTPSHEE